MKSAVKLLIGIFILLGVQLHANDGLIRCDVSIYLKDKLVNKFSISSEDGEIGSFELGKPAISSSDLSIIEGLNCVLSAGLVSKDKIKYILGITKKNVVHKKDEGEVAFTKMSADEYYFEGMATLDVKKTIHMTANDFSKIEITFLKEK